MPLYIYQKFLYFSISIKDKLAILDHIYKESTIVRFQNIMCQGVFFGGIGSFGDSHAESCSSDRAVEERAWDNPL